MLLAVMLLGAGCAAPPAPSAPHIAPRFAPTIEAQAKLLHNARSYLSQGSYEAAGDLLRRLVETHPQSPFLLESHWWLARSYEQAGDLHAALAQYRTLVNIANEHSYGVEARRRIAELEKLLGPTAIQSNGLIAILLPLHDLPAPRELDPWVQTLAQAGITMVLVEAGSSPANVHGVEQGDRQHLQQDRMAASHRAGELAGLAVRTSGTVMIRDGISQLVPIAHRHSLSVFAAITLRRMTGVDPQLDWADRSYDPARRQLRPTQYWDLFHPAFQEYLVGLLTDLAGTGVDGVLFRANAPLGPMDGFSAFGLRGFERDFDLRLDPDKLFIPSTRGAPTTQPRDAHARQEYAPEFWRWAGWKARETLKVLDRLKRAMRKHSPKLRFALEVHPQAITNPVEALAQYGEDLLEAKRSRFDFYLTRPKPGIGERMPGLIERMIDLLGEAERIWVAAPLPAGEIARLAERVHLATDRDALAKGIGLIYMGYSVSVP